MKSDRWAWTLTLSSSFILHHIIIIFSVGSEPDGRSIFDFHREFEETYELDIPSDKEFNHYWQEHSRSTACLYLHFGIVKLDLQSQISCQAENSESNPSSEVVPKKSNNPKKSQGSKSQGSKKKGYQYGKEKGAKNNGKSKKTKTKKTKKTKKVKG